MVRFTITGVIKIAETGVPVPGLFVKAYDLDLIYDDLLGTAFTGHDGKFSIVTELTDFRELFESKPDIYFKIYKEVKGKPVFSTRDGVRFNAAINEFFEILIPAAVAGEHIPGPAITLADEHGNTKQTFEAGESLAVTLTGLQAKSVYDLVVTDEGGRPFFTNSVLSDAKGKIENMLWPQMGFSDFKTTKRFTYQDACENIKNKTFAIEVRRQGETVFTRQIKTPPAFKAAVLFNSESDGRLLNGFEAGKGAAILSIHNLPFNEEEVRVYLVQRQRNWQEGNTFTPALLASGKEAFADVPVKGATSLRVTVANDDELLPGAYDYIVRPLRYGYEDDEDRLLRATDLVTRHLTGLVVRQLFMPSKTVLGGCVNTMPVSGRKMDFVPFYQYSNVFQRGDDVYAALDPAALDPGLIGKKVALYVIQHKDPAEWTASSSVNHLAELGGNAAVQSFITQPDCINMNEVLVWPAASTPGLYDIVADFGNNNPDPNLFVKDDAFNPPLDIIDGYFTEGFRIVDDPGTTTSFANSGTFEYNDGAFVVDDEGSSTTLDKKGVVFFPADIAGATTASQVSTVSASYPLIVVVHGNSGFTNSYQGYNYLLEHLAKNGFIAASIHMNPGMEILGRCEVTLAHIAALKSKFGSTVANNIGLMGHSRGAEAVYIVPRFNHDRALGHAINAVIPLAPTNFHPAESLNGAWSTPLNVMYGSMDGDVSGVTFNGFQLYDRAAGSNKGMVFIYGACHDRFNSVWGDTDITAPWSSLTAADVPKIISAAAHQKIARGYMTAFFLEKLQGKTEYESVTKGEWIPAEVKAADGGTIKLFIQYQDTNHLVLDDFEGPHSATSWQTSAIGGSVNDSGTLVVPPSENTLHALDAQSPHQTAGLLLKWNGLADVLKFDIPPANQNVSAFTAISFRVSQKTASASNPVNMEQNMRLTFTDTAGSSRKVRVSRFNIIPFPHQRGISSLTKSAMCTVRIPLSSYTIQVINTQRVDLTQLASISFEFSVNTTGEIEIDSLEFTR
jgi:hypothetical protein